MDIAAINQQVIREHRAGGPITAPGMHRERIVLLTTTGRRTGESRTVPMFFTPSEGGVLVFASNAGSPVPPAWYANLRADPHVHVELPDGEWDGVATVLDGADRDREWERVVSLHPFLADQQRLAGRQLPVVEIARPDRAG